MDRNSIGGAGAGPDVRVTCAAVPSASTLAAFAVAAFALVALPGPNMIYLVARSVSEGRRAGLLSALGIETGTLVHTFAAAIGLSALLASSATAFSIVKYAGAA